MYSSIYGRSWGLMSRWLNSSYQLQTIGQNNNEKQKQKPKIEKGSILKLSLALRIFIRLFPPFSAFFRFLSRMSSPIHTLVQLWVANGRTELAGRRIDGNIEIIISFHFKCLLWINECITSTFNRRQNIWLSVRVCVSSQPTKM